MGIFWSFRVTGVQAYADKADMERGRWVGQMLTLADKVFFLLLFLLEMLTFADKEGGGCSGPPIFADIIC